MRFSTIPGLFAICKLRPDLGVPDWALSGVFCSVTRTSAELSIICPETSVPDHVKDEEAVKTERGFHCLQLEGPFDFQSIGILESFLAPLAQAGVPVFAVATYDTDCILIQDKHWERALSALSQAGHGRLPESPQSP